MVIVKQTLFPLQALLKEGWLGISAFEIIFFLVFLITILDLKMSDVSVICTTLKMSLSKIYQP